jgi:hypothetical protein
MERVSFCWRDVSAAVKTGGWRQKTGEKVILDNGTHRTILLYGMLKIWSLLLLLLLLFVLV